jgi:hypothetical protein
MFDMLATNSRAREHVARLRLAGKCGLVMKRTARVKRPDLRDRAECRSP